MKSIENFDSINVTNQNSNMFGVSFSPQRNISVPSYAEAVPTSFYDHPTPLHNYGFYYGLESEHVGMYSALPFIADGSIYGNEALSRSQSQAMSIHPYECRSKETMQLNMDGFLYNQTLCHKPNINPNNLNHVQENVNLLGSLAEHQEQQLSYYAALRNNNMMLELEGLIKGQVKDSVQHSNIVEDEVFDVKRWVSRDVNAISSNSQSSCVTSSQETSHVDSVSIDTMKRKNQNQTLGQRTSQYRGVTRHRWTGRYEAHLWDNSCKKEGQARKGKQGGYDMEEKAARAYDRAALKYWGPSTRINFPLENYQKELDVMKKMTRQEYVAHLRRKSSGFSRGASMYRGVTSRHHQHGRWQARIGRVAGNKDLYLGTFTTQEEAGEAYDIAAIKFRGENAVTNFDITRYDVEKIIANSNLLSSEEARRNKKVDDGIINIEEAIIPTQKRCKIQSFSIGLDDIYHQEIEEYSNRVLHMSNASSAVTSLSNSREESPEYGRSLPMLFGMNSTASVPSFSNLPQMPLSVFAAWTDA